MATTSAIQITTNIKTEKEAVKTIADFVRNPPQNPVDVVRFLSKNFSIAGDALESVGKILGIGKAIPMIGAIFDVFASFTAPSIGDQIAQAVEQITSAIKAGVEEIKNALNFSTEKTINAILDEIQGVSMEESALRVIQAVEESEILTQADEEIKAAFDAYTEQVTSLNSQWQDEIMSALEASRKDVEAVYKTIQDALAMLGIDLMDEMLKLYNQAMTAPAPALAQSRSIETAAIQSQSEPKSNGNMATIGLVAAAAAILLFVMKKKKR